MKEHFITVWCANCHHVIEIIRGHHEMRDAYSVCATCKSKQCKKEPCQEDLCGDQPCKGRDWPSYFVPKWEGPHCLSCLVIGLGYDYWFICKMCSAETGYKRT